MTPQERENERLTLTAGLFNSLAATVLAVGVFTPLATFLLWSGECRPGQGAVPDVRRNLNPFLDFAFIPVMFMALLLAVPFHALGRVQIGQMQ